MNIVSVFNNHGAPQRCASHPPCSSASFRSRRAIRLPDRLPVERPAASTAAGLSKGLSSRHSRAYSTPLLVHAALPRCDSISPPEFRIVKVCGVTRSQDAEAAVAAGANAVGMILHRGAKRCVSEATARAIAQAATRAGAEAVGVFVDASAEDMNRCAHAVGLTAVQLHGDVARAAARDIDAEFKARVTCCSCPHSLPEAIQTCRPNGVDVSSGVCDADLLCKDHQLVTSFVHSAWTAFEKADKA
ncbi:hypothetical protein H632_c18p2 [Helicosporidium sp. ATCC 50920]|nr:hypothetical protein H632_c18p2 [Helicosporidium sp. ATCC 50920]|eukprot:KDD77105.1 hypothetical protein H632_c18p2 [Helicosporidium sp. ATCC 50920]